MLDTLLFPDCYKTQHLLETTVDFPIVELPGHIIDFVCSPEPVSLNTIKVESTFLPSADIVEFTIIHVLTLYLF